MITRNYAGDPDTDHYGTYGKAAIDYTTTGSLYFSERNIFEEHEADVVLQDGSEKQVYYYKAADGTINYTTAAGIAQFNEVKRGKNLLYYVPNELEAKQLKEIQEGMMSPLMDYTVGLNSDYNLLSSLPSQPHKIVDEDEPKLFTRLVARKQYEMKDHLGNVRAVVSDRRGFETIAALDVTNQAELVSWADYFPFGMQLTSRHGSFF